jgi:hypothetical protein
MEKKGFELQYLQKLRNFKLYETDSRFYIIGSTYSKKFYKIIKIQKTKEVFKNKFFFFFYFFKKK